MTAIEFYKYIGENGIEFSWAYNTDKKERDVLFFPLYHQIDELRAIMDPGAFDDGGITIYMKYGYFVIWASDILDRYSIELSEVFKKDTKKN